MKLIQGSLPDYISDCLQEIRDLVRHTEIEDGNKNIEVSDILQIIAKYDTEDYFIDREVRISPNTTIRLRRNYEH